MEKAKKVRPTQQRVMEKFHYDPKTGIFLRRQESKTGPKDRRYGKVGAGWISELGYVMLMLDGTNYIAGQLAWLYVNGEWPPARIKYINGDKLDNRIENIRVQSVPKSEIKNARMTPERLRELMHYEPLTGHFTWRINSAVAKPGQRAGGGHSLGYRAVGLDYKKYLEHVLAYLYMTGEWPAGEVDHINGDKTDNRWSNLRLATRSQNGHNKGLHPRSSTGISGVNKHGNKFRARIWDNGVVIDLGCFASLEAAAKARAAAEKKYMGDFKRKDDTPTAMYAMTEINGPEADQYGGRH